MSIDQNELIERNRQQLNSEEDAFTIHRYRQFAAHLPTDVHNVLDVGCNTGRGGRILKRYLPNVRITGLDCVPERLSRLDANIYSSSICAFGNDIPLPGSSFDAIVAGEFIEHIPPELVTTTLVEFFRILRLKGMLLLTTPNPAFLLNKIKGWSVLLDPAHVSQHTPQSLRRRLEDIGFSNIKIRGSGRVSRLLGQHFPYRAVYGSYLAKATKW